MKTLCFAILMFLAFSDFSVAQPLSDYSSWLGYHDVFVSGAPLAVDTDSNGNADSSNQPVSIELTTSDISPASSIVAAYLYWGGTQVQGTSPCEDIQDSVVTLTLPGLGPQVVKADKNYCSDGGSGTYDILMSRANITSLVQNSNITGTYTFDDYDGKWDNESSDNASFSIVIVFQDFSAGFHRILLSDGLMTFQNNSQTLSFGGFDIGTTSEGTMTWYVIEGDNAVTAGTEQVSVQSAPSGSLTVLNDTDNPSTNPMNSTINVVSPVETGTVGIDLDQFDIGAGLTTGDQTIDVTYSTGSDKWWLAFQILKIGQSDPNLGSTIFVSGDGNVGIGTVNPTHKLQVCGSIGTTAASVTTSITCSSDVRFKKDIKGLDHVLDQMQRLRGVSYNWDTERFPQMGFTEVNQIGLIAQEVEQVFPQLVHTDMNGYKSVDYIKLTPLLIEAIKELASEVEVLKNGQREILEMIQKMGSRIELPVSPY